MPFSQSKVRSPPRLWKIFQRTKGVQSPSTRCDHATVDKLDMYVVTCLSQHIDLHIDHMIQVHGLYDARVPPKTTCHTHIDLHDVACHFEAEEGILCLCFWLHRSISATSQCCVAKQQPNSWTCQLSRRLKHRPNNDIDLDKDSVYVNVNIKRYIIYNDWILLCR